MIAGIDKLHRAGDPTGEITAQIQRCLPNFFDSDIAAEWCSVRMLLEHISETGDGPG
jgi:hypothetical protein